MSMVDGFGFGFGADAKLRNLKVKCISSFAERYFGHVRHANRTKQYEEKKLSIPFRFTSSSQHLFDMDLTSGATSAAAVACVE